MAFSAVSSDHEEQTYYQLLGVDIAASEADITRAYRRRMKECHPDRQPPAQRERTETLCKHLNFAYSTLKDPQKRKQYDDTIRASEVQEQIMSRYVGGFGGPGLGAFDPHAGHLRRAETAFERAERQAANRSAMLSLVRAVVVLLVLLVGILVAAGLLSWVVGLVV